MDQLKAKVAAMGKWSEGNGGKGSASLGIGTTFQTLTGEIPLL